MPGNAPYRFLATLTNAHGAVASFSYDSVQATNHLDKQGSSNTTYFGRALRMTQGSVDPGFGGTTMVIQHTGYTNPLGNKDVDWPEFYGHSAVTVRRPACSQNFDTDLTFYQDSRKGRPITAITKDGSGTTVKTEAHA